MQRWLIRQRDVRLSAPELKAVLAALGERDETAEICRNKDGEAEPDTDLLQKMLDAVKPADPGVPCRHRLAMGDPAGEILRIAAEEGVEMIVLGTHGRTGLFRALMGSVAEAVVRRAPCPVLVYRAAAGAVADRRGHALHL